MSREISDEQLLSYFSENGVAIDSLCPNYELYREIYGWLGTRYVYAGLTKSGVDCAGFVSNICNKIYGTNLAGSATHYIEKCDEITDTTQLQEGDLLFFKINKTEISHVAFYLGGGRFVHAALNGGVRFDDLSMAYYAKYYFTAGRLKTVQITTNGK